jgi:hypothetical protein
MWVDWKQTVAESWNLHDGLPQYVLLHGPWTLMSLLITIHFSAISSSPEMCTFGEICCEAN